jgi:hypothetical protein
MAVDDNGEFGHRPMLDAIMSTLTELIAEGLVTEDEARGMCIPIVGRRAADFTVPFAPKGRFERLEIEHLEVFNAEDRFWAQYQTDHDATAFGALWAAFARAAVFPTLATALAGGRTAPRRAQFCDRLEAGIAARLAAEPEPMQIPLAHVVLFKRPKT